MSDRETEKRLAACHAARLVRDGMFVGLGTGTTAAYAVRELGIRVAAGLKITGTATSNATEALASSVGITLVPFDRLARVDLTIDGADEIDSMFRAIKGGGGALLREKVVAAASDEMIVVVDSSKPVTQLGRFPLPVEVLPFASSFVEQTLQGFGASPMKRLRPDGSVFLTDQGSYLYDLSLGAITNPEALAAQLDAIPGVIEHGLFLTEVDTIIIGRGNGVEIFSRKCCGCSSTKNKDENINTATGNSEVV